ncbi:hypothetical protein KEM52_002149 [Ascosphaera acerosa]|nr:hypothetical protein KEM52_002149 [Ascosphaera acerosa]
MSGLPPAPPHGALPPPHLYGPVPSWTSAYPPASLPQQQQPQPQQQQQQQQQQQPPFAAAFAMAAPGFAPGTHAPAQPFIPPSTYGYPVPPSPYYTQNHSQPYAVPPIPYYDYATSATAFAQGGPGPAVSVAGGASTVSPPVPAPTATIPTGPRRLQGRKAAREAAKEKQRPHAQQPVSSRSTDVKFSTAHRDDSEAVAEGGKAVSLTGGLESHESPAGRRRLRQQAMQAIQDMRARGIAFEDIANEGIDRTVLKRLYDDVDARAQTAAEPSASSTHVSVPANTKTEAATRSPPASTTLGQTSAAPASAATSSAPMERKDRIAQLLALKAKKSAPASDVTPVAAETVQPQSQPSESTTQPTEVGPSPALPPSQEQVRQSAEEQKKEKNKAKTELAKLRIEQLKKKAALLRQGDSTSVSPASSPAVVPTDQPSSTQITAQATHPPATSPKTCIPGLTMIDDTALTPGATSPPTAPDTSLPPKPPPIAPLTLTTEATAVPATTTASTSDTPLTGSMTLALGRARKRPRASDFDEDTPDSSFKRPAPASAHVNYSEREPRVVIDLSDDDMYEDDDARDIAGGQAGQAAGIISATHTATAAVSGTTPSLSAGQPNSTPASAISTTSRSGQALPSADSYLKELMALKQRIALYEEKKKARQMQMRIASAESTPPASEGTLTPSPPSAPERSVSVETTGTPESTSPITTVSASAETLAPTKAETVTAPDNEASTPTAAAVIETVTAPDNEASTPTATATATAAADTEHVPAQDVARAEPAADSHKARKELLRQQLINSGLTRLKSGISNRESADGTEQQASSPALSDLDKARERRDKLKAELQARLQEQRRVAQLKKKSEAQQADGFEAGVPTGRSDGADSSHRPDDRESLSSGSATPMQQPVSPPSSEDVSMDESPAEEHSAAGVATAAETAKPADESVNAPETSPTPVERDDTSQRAKSADPEVDTALDTGAISTTAVDVHTKKREPSPPTDGQKEDAADVSMDEEEDELYEPPEQVLADHASEEQQGSSDDGAAPGALDSAVADIVRQEEASLQVPNTAHSKQAASAYTSKFYTPYASPLRNFRSYRFHPDFPDNVSSGFRSLTYSHQINPELEICGFELSGGVCNDSSCPRQHLRDLGMTDENILLQLGQHREGKTAKEKEQYAAGLKAVVTELRARGTQDFDVIARAITAYRRRFLKDDTRVLTL